MHRIFNYLMNLRFSYFDHLFVSKNAIFSLNAKQLKMFRSFIKMYLLFRKQICKKSYFGNLT